LQGMVGAGPGNFLDELIRLAGGENVLASSPIAYPRVSMEQILAADPDVILDMGDFAHHEGKPIESQAELLRLWSSYPMLKAVQQRAVKQVASEVFIRPGPRVGEAAKLFLEAIHGVRLP
ncbi:ABC transporter substrate-binding protein, partial [Thermus sp.]|uniref:ABC transporter substrate-binding protein n=1 Tax=Thermus sp. TaxID=275 RepID=UPI0026163DA9